MAGPSNPGNNPQGDPSYPQGYQAANQPPPPGNYPQGGSYPPQGYPPQNYPPQGYPPQGYPPQGYPPQGYPPPGYQQPGGMYGGGPPPGPPPNNYLGQAVLAIFCCWPFAIPAMINATQVQSRWLMGDQAGARAASAEAKKWANIAIWLGVAWIVIVVALYVSALIFGFALLGYIPRLPSLPTPVP